MTDLREIQTQEFTYGRKLKASAVAAPLILTLLPAIVTLLLVIFAASGAPAAAVTLFFGAVATAIGLTTGIIIAVILARKHSRWTRAMRERMAAHGIKAEHVEWFRNEMKPAERRMLKAVETGDPLLADAYRETLASRLTATRIVKSSKHELLLSKRRLGSVRQLKSARAEEFQKQIDDDINKIAKVHEEAKLMLAEAESRLQMIEAAASRGGTLASSELALKKLSARTAELPLALESAKLTEEIRRELEKDEAG